VSPDGQKVLELGRLVARDVRENGLARHLTVRALGFEDFSTELVDIPGTLAALDDVWGRRGS